MGGGAGNDFGCRPVETFLTVTFEKPEDQSDTLVFLMVCHVTSCDLHVTSVCSHLVAEEADHPVSFHPL